MIAYLKIIRPHQWLKNLMLLFPPFLGGMIMKPGIVREGIVPFIAFCLASSATYILNDLLDSPRDRNHPLKKTRPVAAGQISIKAAGILSFTMTVAAIFAGFRVSTYFALFIVAYLAIFAAYSIKLKELPIIDIFCVAAGFILRLQAGGVAFNVVISEWLFLCVFLLSIFLSIGKRLCEKGELGAMAGLHRKTLEHYPEGFLDMAMSLSGAAVLVTYTMYSLTRQSFIFTVPLCTFGLLRYILRVKSGQGGDPTDSLLKDFPLLVTGVLWVVMVALSIYR